MTVVPIFAHCVQAIRNNVLIQRVSATDKEFHFQNWFRARLEEPSLNFEIGGRNSYPDFRMVAATDGYELTERCTSCQRHIGWLKAWHINRR